MQYLLSVHSYNIFINAAIVVLFVHSFSNLLFTSVTIFAFLDL